MRDKYRIFPGTIRPPLPWNQQMITKKIVIKPTKGWVPLDFEELWQFRELGWALASREVLVRYKQSFLGAGWAIIQPVLTMLIFTLIFSALLGRGNMPSPKGTPYELSTFAALLPWQLFSQSVARASISLVTSQNIITKVYFPRLLIPLAPVLAALIDFSIAFVVLLIFMLYWKMAPNKEIVFLPLFVFLAVAAAFAMSVWLSALNVLYRDIQHAVPFLLQILMYASPIIYSSDTLLPHLPSWAATLYWMNPMAGVAEGFRWVLLGTAQPNILNLLSSVVMTIILLISGLYIFKRIERKFSDIV